MVLINDIYIFNEHDVLVCIASNHGDLSLHFRDAIFTETLNNASTFEFTVLPSHSDSRHVKELNQVAIRDKDGHFRLFRIVTVEKFLDTGIPRIRAICEDAILELNRNIVTEANLTNVTLRQAMDALLMGQTRWVTGEVMNLGNNSIVFYYINSIEALNRCLDLWTTEFKARITISDNRITGRFIDMWARGRDTGLILSVGHNVEGMTFQVNTDHIRTKVFGRGTARPLPDGSSNPIDGSHLQRVMFGNVSATVSTHGFDKPLGQLFVADEVARQLYGLVDAGGNRVHLEAVLDLAGQDDPEALMIQTWKALQEFNKPIYNIQVEMALLEDLLGEDFSHEALRVGDVVRLIDHETFAETIMIESRVMSYTYDLAGFGSANVELGSHRNLYANDDRVRDIENGINDGRWTRPPVIDEEHTVNRPPSPITNFKAFGGFSLILLFWDMQNSFVTRHFELHASQVQGFVPSPANLIYRGHVASFSHDVGANTQWYYRVRAVNHHGVASPWSEEVYAHTANTRPIEDLEEDLYNLNNNLIPDLDDRLDYLNNNTIPALNDRLEQNRSDLDYLEDLTDEWRYLDTVEIDGGSLRARTVDAYKIRARSITALEIQARTITAEEIFANTITANEIASGTITANEIFAGTITADEIASNAITANHIGADVIVGNHIHAGAITTSHMVVGTINGDRIAVGTLHADRIQAGTITASHIGVNSITADRISTGILTGVILESRSPGHLVRVANGRVDVHFQGDINQIGMRLDQGTLRIMGTGLPTVEQATPPTGEIGAFVRNHNANFTQVTGTAIVSRGANSGLWNQISSQGGTGWGFSRPHLRAINNSAGTTQIFGFSAQSVMQLNGYGFEGDTHFYGEGNIDIRDNKVLKLRKIGTTNFTDNAEIEFVTMYVEGIKGMLICDCYPNPTTGFWIGQGKSGIMVDGKVILN